MKIKKILKRCTAAMLAAAIGMTTLTANVSAATSGISIGYTWNSSVNPTIKNRKNGVNGGISGQFIKAGEQICRFCPSTTSDWAFCIEPAKSMQGASYKDWYTQNGFTKYDTFDLSDKNKADSFAYWKSIGGTNGPMARYLGLVQYYGYSSHKNGDYYAATQCLIWELILGYRGHTQATFSKCSDILWNDFTYPSGGWCTKSGVEKAYNDIVSNVKNHYKLPTALKSTKAQAKDEANILKYNVVNLRYETKVTVPTSYVTASSLAHNFSGLKSKLESLIKSKFSGTFGKDYGIETEMSGTNTVYTVWSKERPFTSSSDSSIYTTDEVRMQMKDSLKKQETLFANSYYQTCLLSTRLDPIAGYVGLGSYNEPNLTVEKTYTDSGNNQITATELNTLLGKTTFVISCLYDGKKYYVQADKNSTGTGYVFSKYVTSIDEATKFKTLKNTETKGTFVKSVTTDKNGYVEVTELALGKLNGDTFENVYTVTERENDKYIMLDENGELSRSFTVTTTLSDIEDKTNPVITYTADIPNTLQLVDLKVHKVDEFGNPIKGVAFDIVPTQDIAFNGKTVQKKGELVGTVVTDENGCAGSTYTEYETDGTQGYTKTIPIYPNFEYELVEISVPEPYVIPAENTRFTVKSDKADTLTIPHEVTVTNDVQRGTLEVFKADSETKNPLAGVEFEVRAAEDFYLGSAKIHSKNDLICTMISGADGHADTGNAQMYVGAKYNLTETKAAEGYAVNSDSKTFEFNFAGNTVSYSKLSIDVGNDSQKGRISVYKSGDAFTGVTALGSAISVDENGEIIESGQTSYTPVFTKCALGGAVFQVTAAEDIVTADGTVHAKAGDVVTEITTDENGYAETPLIYLGKYEVREIKAPFGYVLNSQPKTAELTYAGQEIAVRDTVNTAFENDYQGVRISLSKIMENDELFGIYGKDCYTSVRFGLFAAEEITASNGTSIPADGLISQISLDENMTAVIAEKIPFGKYYVQEIATDEKYILNGEKYLVTFEYMGQDIQTVDIDCGQFLNSIKRGSVHGNKVNESGEPLENALFGLFAVDTSEFTNGNAIMTAVSDENGYFEFSDIAYGDYMVCEIEAPAGYIFSDEKYPVTISENGAVVEIIAENKPIMVEISKRDVYGNELKGAEMQLIDSEGNVVDEWTSDDTNHIVTELPAGDYTLHETAAPDGYVIATEIGFTVDIYGNVSVENVESTATSENGNPLIVMVDDTTKVQISKQDITTGEELPGATIQIIDKDGDIVEEWVSGNEPHFIEAELIAGEKYTLHETAAPNGYVIANDVEFTVNSDGTVTEVVMKDDTTKVKISKQDITTGEELPGATLQIIDEDGNIVEEWVSTGEPHFIEEKLIAGKEYTLRETIAPEGYEIANEIKFIVNADGSVTEVVMYDERKPVPEKPETPNTPQTPTTDVPNTGVSADNGVAIYLISGALLIIVGSVIRKKRED